MFTNPCRYYWGDLRDKRYLSRSHAKHQARLSRDSTHYKEESDVLLNAYDESLESVGNSLLASMGKLGRDNLLLISDLNCQRI